MMKLPDDIVGTVYSGGYDVLGGKFVPRAYIAKLTAVGENREPRFMVSSDLEALQQRMRQFGLHRRPPHPRDPSVILEVWTHERAPAE
jgi:hypothetical protein